MLLFKENKFSRNAKRWGNQLQPQKPQILYVQNLFTCKIGLLALDPVVNC